MRLVLENKGERGSRIYNRPVSAIRINDKKINYYDYISSMENTELNEALLRVVPRIKEKAIIELVDSISILSNLQKEFYKVMLLERKHIILDETYNLLMKKNKEENVCNNLDGMQVKHRKRGR